MKEKLIAHIESARPYTVIWCGLVSLAGACLTYQGFPPLQTSFLAFLIPMMGWIAGLYLSDYLDRNLDRIQKPHRPIPSGRIHPNEALGIGAVFAISGFLLSFLLGLNNVVLVFVVALLVFLYAKLSKSRGIFGNLNRGFVTIIAYFYGILAVNTPLNLLPLSIVVLGVVFIIHDTTSNLVGAMRDIEGDRKGGYQTIPVQYGVKKSLQIALILTLCYYLLTTVIIVTNEIIRYLQSSVLILLLAFGIILIMYADMFRSMQTITRHKALRAHQFFIAERITFASAFLFGTIKPVWIPLIIFVLSLFITLISQYMLRNRYEFMEKP